MLGWWPDVVGARRRWSTWDASLTALRRCESSGTHSILHPAPGSRQTHRRRESRISVYSTGTSEGLKGAKPGSIRWGLGNSQTLLFAVSCPVP